MKTIRWKITVLILFSISVITFLFILNTFTDNKRQDFEKDINTLTEFNNELQNSVICEKTYRNAPTPETKSEMRDHLSKANEQIQLIEKSTYFQGNELNSLKQFLKDYRTTFVNLTKITEKVDFVNILINDNLYSFTKEATHLIEKADEAVSNAFMNGDDIDPGVQVLSDTTRNIIVVTNSIPLTLSRDLFLDNDTEKYSSECKTIFKKLGYIHANFKTAVNRMAHNDDYYTAFLKTFTQVQNLLAVRSEEIGHLWPEKVLLQTRLDTVRDKTLMTRDAIFKTGRAAVNRFQRNMALAKTVSFICVLFILILGGGLTLKSITRSIRAITVSLEDSSTQLSEISEQVSLSSRELADDSQSQAESIRETSSSLEEIASMTKLNADNAEKANTLIRQSGIQVDKAAQIMNELTDSMSQIAESSQEITEIIKSIDSIAFQTNLLSLNASVEAARAGEAGAGFAVVATEVRNLAVRSGESAKKTEIIVKETLDKVRRGSELVSRSSDAIKAIVDHSTKIDAVAHEISQATQENSSGLNLITRSVENIDTVTQKNNSSAEHSANAAEAMKDQARTMKELVAKLTAIIDGKHSHKKKTGRRAQAGAKQLASEKRALPESF
jgi:methyl-accepting chemotaxis protein